MQSDGGAALRLLAESLRAHVCSLRRSGIPWVQGVPPPAAAEPGAVQADPRAALQEIEAELAGCTRCKLHTGRRTVVCGEGNPRARLVFVGEAPGREEDERGVPFIGEAGQLLTRIIAAIGLQRGDVYITNIVKCRPPQNRDPEEDEVRTCIPFLHRQLQVIQPRIVCALGRHAAQALLGTGEGITRLRGRFHRLGDMLVMPTYHPSYLLRTPARKRETWIDMQMVQREYENGAGAGQSR